VNCFTHDWDYIPRNIKVNLFFEKNLSHARCAYIWYFQEKQMVIAIFHGFIKFLYYYLILKRVIK